jgi:hypothetical protein
MPILAVGGKPGLLFKHGTDPQTLMRRHRLQNLTRDTRLLPWLAAILGAVLMQSVSATEGGGSNYLPGFYGDFAMAVMPDKGTFFNNFFAAYQDRSGQIGSVLEMPGVIHVTEWDILGGRFLLGGYPGVMGTWDGSGKDNKARFGLGDFYLVPFGLNWKWPDVAVLAFEGIVAPTGYYQKGEVNPGRNVWTFDHIAAVTWTLPAHCELNLIFGYMNNLENHATGYVSGDEFHFDYTAAYYLRDDVGLGVNGSYYRQVTGDSAPLGVELAPRGEAASIGPAVMWTPRVGDRDVTLSLKWLHEFNVTGRAAYDYLIWKVFVGF